MKINIRGQKLEITDPIKKHIENKLTRLEKYFNKPEEVNVHVLAKVKGINQTIEVTIPINKVTLRAEESHSDLYAAVDLVIDKLDAQIRRNKDKLKKRRTGDSNEFNFADNLPDEDLEKDIEKGIVKRKIIELKPMDEEEAILQMEMLNHDFFLFKNIDKECFSVIYRRKDGNYGVIDTE